MLRKNKIKTKAVKIEKKNIFIITSCINVNDNIEYHIHNPEHTATRRLSEAVIGLKSVRSFYKDAHIIFIESS